jgi:glutaredoxin
MTVITIVTSAKCKHCKFAKKYRPMKKDGSLSWKTKTTCTNPESPRSLTDIKQSYLVCDKWKL